MIAVDPWDCGCTECKTGEYVSLRYATDENVADLLAGRLRSNLGEGTRLDVSVVYVTTWEGGGPVLRPDSVTVTYTHGEGGEKMEWTPDLYRAGLAGTR